MQYLSKRSKNRRTARAISMMAFFVCLLTGCSAVSDEALPSENFFNTYDSAFSVTKADQNTDFSSEFYIDLSTVSDHYVLTEAGDYLLTGELDGNICIDAEEQIVHLIFDGIDIHSFNGPAISVISAGKVIITINSDTLNNLSDSGYYDVSSEENACIYSNSDLTINGNGTLNVSGFYRDGIHSKDIIKVLGGEVNILSKRDGIRGNDGILIRTDLLNIESEGSGLHTTKTDSNIQGDIEISGGSVSVISGEYAINSAGGFYISDCSIYTKSILGNFHVSGDQVIQEGCIIDE